MKRIIGMVVMIAYSVGMHAVRDTVVIDTDCGMDILQTSGFMRVQKEKERKVVLLTSSSREALEQRLERCEVSEVCDGIVEIGTLARDRSSAHNIEQCFGDQCAISLDQIVLVSCDERLCAALKDTKVLMIWATDRLPPLFEGLGMSLSDGGVIDWFNRSANRALGDELYLTFTLLVKDAEGMKKACDKLCT